MAIDQRDTAGELADLGQKLSRWLIDDGRDMAEPVAMGNADLARQHYEHAGTGLAGLEQRLAMLVAAYLAKPPHAVDFVRGQRRKGLLISDEGSGSAGWVHTTDVCHVGTRLPYSDASLPASSREALPSAEDAAALSLRPLACDLRRLRFSRSASFSRSCREEPLPLSSCVIDLFAGSVSCIRRNMAR